MHREAYELLIINNGIVPNFLCKDFFRFKYPIEVLF